MATANVSWTACGSAANGQYLYYGKYLIVTGTPISGTGWTIYSGSSLPNTQSSATITGLDDNVEYAFYVYCDCSSSGSGTGPLSNIGPLIKYVCPTVSNTTPTYNGLNYTISVPSSANNAGSWIQTIVVSILDSSGVNTITSNTFNAPFSSTISSNFTGLMSSSNYNLKIAYSNTGNTRTNNCGSTPFTTAASCPNPTITISNITSTSFDVGWTPTTGGSFDILLNGNAIATGLTSTNGTYTVTGLSAATIYQIAVRMNCTTGGTGISATQNVTTNASTVNGMISVNCSVPNTSTSTGTFTMSFTFPQATTFPITIYFGQVYEIENNSSVFCNAYNGYTLFNIPVGSNGTCAGGNGFTNFGGDPSFPWIINIPQGVSNYTTAVNSIYTQSGPTGYSPWQREPNITGNISQITDLYVKVNSPVGNAANFTISNGQNTSGITIHNV